MKFRTRLFPVISNYYHLQISLLHHPSNLSCAHVLQIITAWMAHGVADRLHLTLAVSRSGAQGASPILDGLRAHADVATVDHNGNENDSWFTYTVHMRAGRIITLEFFA